MEAGHPAGEPHHTAAATLCPVSRIYVDKCPSQTAAAVGRVNAKLSCVVCKGFVGKTEDLL